jgi:WD40 repeat protein
LELNNHGGIVLAVDWSQDGHLSATSGANEVIKIWDATTGTEQQTWDGCSGWGY